MEPFYIRQTADVPLGGKAREWFKICAAEAQSEGAKHCRFSHHPGPVLLIECWNVPPREVGDEGDFRLSMLAPPPDARMNFSNEPESDAVSLNQNLPSLSDKDQVKQ